jgi:hypothetical protein
MKSKILNILKIILGFVIMFGCFTPLYLIDRLISVPLIWLKSDNFIVWLRDNKQMLYSGVRVGFLGLIWFIVWCFI